MSEIFTLKGQIRNDNGTGPSRALRREGMIPAIIYGGDQKPISISVEEKEVTKLYRRHGLTSTPIEIDIDGKKYKVLPKAVELHPITDLAHHADFVFLAKKGTQKVLVPIVYEGRERCLGIKRGGFLNIIYRKVSLTCQVDKIPLHLVVDVTNIRIGSSIKASNLVLPEGAKLNNKSDFVIASITGRGGKSDPTEEDKAAAA